MSRENNGYRYSPLFLCLKDIKHCLFMGEELSKCRQYIDNKDRHSAFFAAIVLVDIALDNLIKVAFNSRDKFIEKYMKIRDRELQFAIGKLRDAIVHSGYSLNCYHPLRPKKGRKQEKIYFCLGLYNWLIRKDNQWKRNYPSRMFEVNPRMLYLRFKDGVQKLKNELLNNNNEELREYFKKNLDLDAWILITSGFTI